MANGTSGELKGRVIGVGPARGGDKAQIALIDDFLRCQGAAGARTSATKLKRQGLGEQVVGNIKQMMDDTVEMMENLDAKLPLTEVRGGMLQPNSILPSQYFGPRKRLPEHGLMSAVLQDAIECVAKYRAAKDCRSRRLFREAKQWLIAEETDWPYAFKCICGALDLDAHAVRSAVGVLERPSVLVSREIQNAHMHIKPVARSTAGVCSVQDDLRVAD